jgi:hypothetical protein
MENSLRDLHSTMIADLHLQNFWAPSAGEVLPSCCTGSLSQMDVTDSEDSLRHLRQSPLTQAS